jgi:ABC-type multidrug transport system fused ATPase/permease subunit
LTGLWRKHLCLLAPDAERNLRHWLKRQPDRSSAFRGEVALIADAFRALADEGGGHIADEIEGAVSDFAAQADRWREEIVVSLVSSPPEIAARLSEALALLSDALHEQGTERELGLSDAMFRLRSAVSHPLIAAMPLPWVALAWLEWQINGRPEEASTLLDRALSHRPDPAKPSTLLARRLAAHLLEVQGNAEGGLSILNSLVSLVPCPHAHGEAVALAAALGNRPEVRRHLESTLALLPSSLIRIVAEDAVGPFMVDVVEISVRLQIKARQDARQAVADWTKRVSRVRQSFRLAGMTESGLSEERNALAEARDLLERADLLTLRSLALDANRHADALTTEAEQALQTESLHRRRSRARVLQSLESVRATREEAVLAASRLQSGAVAEAQGVLNSTAHEADQATRGCGLGLLMATGTIVFAMALASLLAPTGMNVSFRSTFGTIAIALTMLPLAVSTLLLMAATMRRLRNEARYSEVVSSAAHAYNRAVRAADEVYRAEAAKHQSELVDADLALRRTDEAIRVLSNFRQAA